MARRQGEENWEAKRLDALAELEECDWEDRDSEVTVNLMYPPTAKSSRAPAPAKAVAHILREVPHPWRGPIVLALVLLSAVAGVASKAFGLW